MFAFQIHNNEAQDPLKDDSCFKKCPSQCVSWKYYDAFTVDYKIDETIKFSCVPGKNPLDWILTNIWILIRQC